MQKNKKKISVLFVREDSIYKSMNLDCWDIKRDARNWNEGCPLIAHPPCRAWGRLSHFAKPRPDEKELAIYSINLIRKYGGVLEHPAASKLWKEMNLPKGNEIDKFGGFSLCINQSWFGHKAEKRTLLYICGCCKEDLPIVPLKFDAIEFVIETSIKKGSSGFRKSVTKKEREATPVELAKWLVEVAEKCTKNNIHDI